MMRYFWVIFFSLFAVSLAFSNAEIPSADLKGAKDSPLVKRYEGSLIVAYDHKAFDEFTLPLSKLEKLPAKRDIHNNFAYEPSQKKDLEGERTRIVYLIPEGRSPLEVVRNYQEEVEGKGGKALYQCKVEECGGSAKR